MFNKTNHTISIIKQRLLQLQSLMVIIYTYIVLCRALYDYFSNHPVILIKQCLVVFVLAQITYLSSFVFGACGVDHSNCYTYHINTINIRTMPFYLRFCARFPCTRVKRFYHKEYSKLNI